MYSKSTATITSILEAAQRLFLQKNYADVTMGEIAQAARVTKGALYHHFASKEALYLAMMHADLNEKQALFQSAASGDGTCRDRLRRLTMSFLELPAEKRETMKLVRRDVNVFKGPAREKLIRTYQTALPEQIEAILRDGIQSEEVAPADPRLLAWEYVAMVEVVLSRYARASLGAPECTAEYVLDLFFEGARGEQHRKI